MKHFTFIICKPNPALKNLIQFFGGKDPYNIDQWILFDQKMGKAEAIKSFDSFVSSYPEGLNAILFTGKNKSTIVKQIGKVS